MRSCGGTDLRPEHVDLRDQRDEPRLQRVHVGQLVLRVHHLLGEAVARRLERFELRAAHQLVLQLAIHVRADGVEAVQPALERLDEWDACRHAGELRIELGHRFVEPGRLQRALLDERHLAEDGVHLRFELGRAGGECGHPLVERLERHAIGAQLVAELDDLDVRLVEVLNLLAQRLEIVAALPERVHVDDGSLGELVHLSQLLVQRVERQLLLRQIVGLREEGIEALRQAIDLLAQRDEVLVLGRKRFHPRFGVAHRALQGSHPLVERIEFLLPHRQRTHFGPEDLEERGRILLQLGRLALDFLVQLRGDLHPQRRVGRKLVDAADGLFGFRRLLHPFVQLGDLHVHGPDHLVDAIGLHHGVLDRLLLAVERLRLARDVLGERVQSGKALFGVAAQLVQLRERHQLLLDLLDGGHGRRRVLARFARGFTDLAVVLRQRRGARPDLIELALERGRLCGRLRHFGFGVAQVAAKLVEHGAFLLEGVEGGMRLQRLRGEVLHRLAMLLELAVRADRLLRRQLGLFRRILQRLNALVDVLELPRAVVEHADSFRQLVELRAGARRLLRHLLERLAERHQLRTPRRQRGQHGAERAALFAGGGDEQLQLVGLLLHLFPLATRDAPERVQHMNLLNLRCRRSARLRYRTSGCGRCAGPGSRWKV